MDKIRSMTGYGKGACNDGVRSITAEIKTINNRYSDINVKTPRTLRMFEDTARRLVKNTITRGRIDVFLGLEYISVSDTVITPNVALAKEYKNAILKIKEELELSDEPRLDTIIKFQDVLVAVENEEDEKLIEKSVEAAINEALEKLVLMREKEGEQLKLDVLNGVNTVRELVGEIKKRSATLVAEYKDKLEVRVKELLGANHQLDENRLYNEIVYYSDKTDVNEELTRLDSHILQIEATLEEGGAIGKKLDFIIQEANREINTIGSKVGNIEITKFVIEVKNTLEKIREQIQNIE